MTANPYTPEELEMLAKLVAMEVKSGRQFVNLPMYKMQRLLATFEALAADAKRYRFWRDAFVEEMPVLTDALHGDFDADGFDRYTDAAMERDHD